jgi:hypothetical protein
MSTAPADRQQFRATLAALATKTQAKMPALNGRVEKACKLVLGGDVTLSDDGTALVGSLSNPTITYQVAPGLCQCKDFDHAPEHLCCHRLAVGFARKVHELLAARPAPALEPPAAPLPEAPASCNVYVTISGHKVQVTLRDTDEGRLLARLEAVLHRFPAPEKPADDTRQCPKHGVPMQLNHSKDGRAWYSHKTNQGWCKGK